MYLFNWIHVSLAGFSEKVEEWIHLFVQDWMYLQRSEFWPYSGPATRYQMPCHLATDKWSSQRARRLDSASARQRRLSLGPSRALSVAAAARVRPASHPHTRKSLSYCTVRFPEDTTHTTCILRRCPSFLQQRNPFSSAPKATPSSLSQIEFFVYKHTLHTHHQVHSSVTSRTDTHHVSLSD